MVSSATNLTHSGLRDWLIQRVSAVIIAIYTLILLAFFLLHPNLSFTHWYAFITNPVMRMLTFLTLLSVILHAWVGLWTILTDYVKPLSTRFLLEVLIGLGLLTYLVWGIEIIWGV